MKDRAYDNRESKDSLTGEIGLLPLVGADSLYVMDKVKNFF
jgi:hypothetical protein